NGREAFDECGFDGGARSGERVKHHTAGWGDETEQPTHDLQWLHGGVLHTVHVRTLRLRGLRTVEESGRAASAPVGNVGAVAVLPSAAIYGVGLLGFGVAVPVDSHPAFSDPALFVCPCGGVVVESHVRRPTTGVSNLLPAGLVALPVSDGAGAGRAGVASGRGLPPCFCERPQFGFRVATVKPEDAALWGAGH